MTAADRLRALLTAAAGDAEPGLYPPTLDAIVDRQMALFASTRVDIAGRVDGGAVKVCLIAETHPQTVAAEGAVTETDQPPIDARWERVFDQLVALGQELSRGEASFGPVESRCSEQWACAKCVCLLPAGHGGDHERSCGEIRCGPHG